MHWKPVTEMLVAIARERGGYGALRSWFGIKPYASDGTEPDAIAKMAGYPTAPYPSSFVELTPGDAVRMLAFLAVDNFVMPKGKRPSDELSRIFEAGVERLGPGARFFSNGEWLHPGSASWQPLSNATFDGGVIGFNDEVGFIVWAEEED